MASHKLKKLQTIRRIEREDAEEQRFAQAVAAELNNINFAEQSQTPAFGGKSEARISKCETCGAYGENFAKQSQSPAFGGKSEALNPKPETGVAQHRKSDPLGGKLKNKANLRRIARAQRCQ